MTSAKCKVQKISRKRLSNAGIALHAGLPAIAACVALAFSEPAATATATATATAYQYLRTVSGAVRCMVSQTEVVCERTSIEGFPQAPATPGGHLILAHVTAAGSFNWNDGNIGNPHPEQDVVLGYGQTYRYNGWTIMPSSDGTRFTNDGTGHGMFVSVDDVSAF